MQGNFYNQVIDKKGLKRILSWFIENYGPTRTSQLIEYFKLLGFHYATRAGLSLGFEDLKIPPSKRDLLVAAQKEVQRCENNYVRGTITAFERYQKLIDIWTTTSENLKEEVVKNFQKTPLNPLYMMAFSGARGNISQVRQLVGMRGLMSDSGGGIIDFPIRSNFREGLSVTEYVISCYGARKGLIDTALRTADSGYLTRRLVDVAHSIMVYEIDCGTTNSIAVPLNEKNLLGRVLASTLRIRFPKNRVLAWKNQDISATLAREIITAANGPMGILSENNLPLEIQSLHVRSPLTCQSRGICQLCYGWNLAQGRFVSIGDAVGVLAAQSIGEPGTQLTMRTFHTGGIFSTDILDKIFVPHDGVIAYEKMPRGCKVRSVHGETGFLTFEPVKLCIKGSCESILQLPAQSLIFAYPGKYVRQNDLCAEISRLVEDHSPNTFVAGPESKTEIESDGAVKIVLSEIQGQVSFGFSSAPQSGYPTSQAIQDQTPNEIWVLAGDTFVSSGPVGKLGDLLYWRGSRGRREVANQNFRGVLTSNVKAAGDQRKPFEVRGNVVVQTIEQKRVSTYKRPAPLGGLVRSKDSLFKTEYTSQIIRKIGRFGGFAFLRRVQPHLLSGGKVFANGASANLRPLGSIVYERDPVCQLLLPNQQSKTGDIVQGLPKIEQLFEGRGGTTTSGSNETLVGVRGQRSDLSFFELRSQIQQRLVDEIQAVYQSQGVEIADKHVEIIVRLMTSKVRILEKGTSPFFPDDIVDLHFIQMANVPETHYEPIVLGITKVAFLTESFVSAASFQETKRVLMSSALQNRVDFLNGLKENVIVGRLIPAGTGA